MAYFIMAEPTETNGVCETECKHIDCAEARRLAETPCDLCHEIIAPGRAYVFVSAKDGIIRHFACEPDA